MFLGLVLALATPEESLACCADQKIALLGAMQSLFEGSMYTFVFLWTPALSPNGEHLPHGMIFACFMVGSSVLLIPGKGANAHIGLGGGKRACDSG